MSDRIYLHGDLVVYWIESKCPAIVQATLLSPSSYFPDTQTEKPEAEDA